MLKITSSVSSPSITDLVRHSAFSLSQHELTSPASLSLLLKEFMLPVHESIKPVKQPVETVRNNSLVADNVIFTIGCDEEDSIPRFNRDEETNDELMGKMYREPLSSRRNYTMPDLHVVSCF